MIFDSLKLLPNNIPADYLQDKCSVSIILASDSLEVTDTNNVLLKLLGLNDVPVGKHMRNYVSEESIDFLEKFHNDENTRHNLTFIAADFKILPMSCLIFKSSRGFAIFAENMVSEKDIMNKMTSLNNEMFNMARELKREKTELEEAHSKIKVLGGLIPICASCKSIRDDKGFWEHIEAYISEHSEASFSHGICPKCMKKLYPNYFQKK